MSILVNKTASIFFSSDTTVGARNVSPDGSTFTVYLNTPIGIPKAAVDASISIQQASIWNTSYNISADFNNNNFTFTSGAVTHSLTIPAGLYSLGGLSSFLSTQFVNLGLVSNLISLSGDDSTQRTLLTFLNAGDSVNFTVANSVRLVLGFNSRVVVSPSGGYSEYSDNTASFNRVNSYLIRSNIVSQGIPINTIGAGIIASVPITVAPGSEIVYAPTNPIIIDASELIGQSKNVVTFSLLDQSLRPTPTAGELWSFVLVFKWSILLTDKTVPMMSF